MQDDRGFKVVTRSHFPGWAVQEAGAPEAIITELRSDGRSPELHLDITWVNKTPTRLPEVSFASQHAAAVSLFFLCMHGSVNQ